MVDYNCANTSTDIARTMKPANVSPVSGNTNDWTTDVLVQFRMIPQIVMFARSTESKIKP